MKNLIIVLFLLLTVNVFSQKHDFDKLSRLVFDEINVERKNAGLLEFVWDDSLFILVKKTNEILKREKRLYHPDYDQKVIDNYERILVNRYNKMTNNKKFKYESADAWGFVRDYNFLGEVIVLTSTDFTDSIGYKNIVKTWLDSGCHRGWLLIHDTLVDDKPYSPFCSCDSDYIQYKNKTYVIVTCNMYVINIRSEWKFYKP